MGKAGGGRNEVDQRFMSMFAVFNLVFPADKTLLRIYSSIVLGHLEIFPEELHPLPMILMSITLNLYKVICYRFSYVRGNHRNVYCRE